MFLFTDDLVQCISPLKVCSLQMCSYTSKQLCVRVCMCVCVCVCVCRTCCVDSVQPSGDVLFLWACSIHQRALSTVWRRKDMVNGVMRKYMCMCVCVCVCVCVT